MWLLQSRFVDQTPDADTLAKMYVKASYHDAHYLDGDSAHCRRSAKLLSALLPVGASVLDSGCGLGLFLKALQAEGSSATGVDFDQEAADYASKSAGCPPYSIATFLPQKNTAAYDALYLGDVLGHLPDPVSTLRELFDFVKSGGILFVGPLENNPSPVFGRRACSAS